MLALARVAGCHAHALHIDHGLRTDSSGEASIVEEAAQLLGATFQAMAIAVAGGPDLEAAADASLATKLFLKGR